MTEWRKYKDETPIEGQLVSYSINGYEIPFAGIYKDNKFIDAMDYTYKFTDDIIYWISLPKFPQVTS